MAVMISLGIAVVVVAFVVAPFFLLTGRPVDPAPKGSDNSEALVELLAEKETIYAAIQELDFDLASGKLSSGDHAALRQRHEAEAAALLQRIDEVQATATRPGEKARSAHRGKPKG